MKRINRKKQRPGLLHLLRPRRLSSSQVAITSALLALFAAAPARAYSNAHDINATGQVVGYGTDATGHIKAVLRQNGGIQRLGTLGGSTSNAYAINDAGLIVGQATNSGGGGRGFLRTGTGGMLGLNTLLVAGSIGFGGTLKVVAWNGFAGQSGQHVDLFDWGTSAGTFATIDLSGATLAKGLAWDTSALYSTGELFITGTALPVPEPETWAPMLAGCGVVAGATWRRSARRL